MLEGIFEIWIKLCLVEEFRASQVGEASPQVVFGKIGNTQKERKRYVFTDHRSRLQESLRAANIVSTAAGILIAGIAFASR